MNLNDFTEAELSLLRLAFNLVETVTDWERSDNYDVELSNALFHLNEKLGIYDLID